MPDLEACLSTQVVVQALRQVMCLIQRMFLVVDVEGYARFSDRRPPHAAHASAFVVPEGYTNFIQDLQ